MKGLIGASRVFLLHRGRRVLRSKTTAPWGCATTRLVPHASISVTADCRGGGGARTHVVSSQLRWGLSVGGCGCKP